MYEHEYWVLTKKPNSNMKVLILVKGISEYEKPTLYETFKITPIINKTIQTHQLRWFGLVMRRDGITTKKALDIKVNGEKPRGRPRTSWLKFIENILKERVTNLEEVESIPLNIIAWRKCLTD